MMAGEFWLWAGFVISWLWHIGSWGNGWIVNMMSKSAEAREDKTASDQIFYYNTVVAGHLAMSGIAIAAFGYFLFP